jgi:hypothetical protein
MVAVVEYVVPMLLIWVSLLKTASMYRFKKSIRTKKKYKSAKNQDYNKGTSFKEQVFLLW